MDTDPEKTGPGLRKRLKTASDKSLVLKEPEELIRGKKEEETHSRLIRVFRKKHGVNVRTPQAITGHKEKHMV